LDSDSDTYLRKALPYVSDSNQEQAQNDNTKWTNNKQCRCGVPVIHRFTGDPGRIRQNKAPAINKDLTPLSFFILNFLLVEETNINYQQYLDTQDEGRSPLPDGNVQEMYSFLAIIVQTGTDQKYTPKSILEHSRTV
jgi:hypothetical protein